MHIAGVNVVSRDDSRCVDADGEGSLITARACARSLEPGYPARDRPHEAVTGTVRVNVVSRDSPRRVDAEREGSLMKALARARTFEDRYLAIGSHKAVTQIVRVKVESGDFPCRVDADGNSSLKHGLACARSLEGDEGGLAAVLDSCNFPLRGRPDGEK